jgi:hypothetical protein
MQAAKDLSRAEAEIELLQHLLREREGQVSAGTQGGLWLAALGC